MSLDGKDANSGRLMRIKMRSLIFMAISAVRMGRIPTFGRQPITDNEETRDCSISNVTSLACSEPDELNGIWETDKEF